MTFIGWFQPSTLGRHLLPPQTILRRPEPPEERVEPTTLRVTAIIEPSPFD